LGLAISTLISAEAPTRRSSLSTDLGDHLLASFEKLVPDTVRGLGGRLKS